MIMVGVALICRRVAYGVGLALVAALPPFYGTRILWILRRLPAPRRWQRAMAISRQPPTAASPEHRAECGRLDGEIPPPLAALEARLR